MGDFEGSNCLSNRQTLTLLEYCCNSEGIATVAALKQYSGCPSKSPPPGYGNFVIPSGSYCWAEALDQIEAPNCFYGQDKVNSRASCCAADGVALEIVFVKETPLCPGSLKQNSTEKFSVER